MRIGTRVAYIGPTIMLRLLPRGTQGIVTDVLENHMFPIICDFCVQDGDHWPMHESELAVIQ